MEPRFGHNFGRVRVHADPEAAASAEAVYARAYTAGHHIVMGAGQPSWETSAGRRLWAHELAHVVQHSLTPQSNTAAHDDVAAEAEADGAADKVAGGGPVGLIWGRSGSAFHRQSRGPVKPTRPTLITDRRGDTALIEDAYGAGTLDPTRWRTLLASAAAARASRLGADAIKAYLTLYADVAKLAQASRVLRSAGDINVVSGSKHSCKDAKPGLNFSPLDSSGWGAVASTAYVDGQGTTFGTVTLNARGALQPQVAIVLSRSAFVPEKEQTLATLRHEMVHAEHLEEAASDAFLPDTRRHGSAPTPPTPSSKEFNARTELLAYTEGFMTMFHLTNPAPIDPHHPAYIELLGVLNEGPGGIYPWADADPADRSEALGRLQEYYCHALDRSHREAFEAWVGGRFDPDAVSRDFQQHNWDFFPHLRGIIASNCKGLETPMALSSR